MIAGRRLVARFSNFGLVVFGLALVIVLGTGGTRIDLRVVSIGLREVAAPVTFFAFFAALRLLASSRGSGLEARLVTFLARQGLPPRDAPATLLASVRAGALLGLGAGFVVAVADLVRLVLATPPPSPTASDLVALTGIGLALGLLSGAFAGTVAGLVTGALVPLLSPGLGRYEAGRWTVAQLVMLASAAVWLAPPVGSDEHTPAVLLAVAGSVFPALAAAFLAIPAAVLRARRGRWGLAVTGLAALALALGCAAIVALGPTGLYGPARDAIYPNILLISVSGLRTEFIGAYRGSTNQMPNLTSMAHRGAYLREVVSPSTDIAAASASLLTGLYPAAHGLRGPGDQLRPGIDGLPAVLAGHGFRTAAFVSCRPLGGRETGLAQMFERYDDPTSLVDWIGRMSLGRPLVRPTIRVPRVTRPAESTVAAFHDWIGSMPRGPWFAWVQLADLLRPEPVPAEPSEIGAPPVAGPAGERLPSPPAWADPDERREPLANWLAGYVRAVRGVDAQIAALEQIVAGRGESHRTLFLVVSEQGTALGEDGVWFDHPRGLEQGVVLVPWIAYGAGVRAGTVVDGPGSLVDVAPTALGMIGLGGAPNAEGEDLSRYLAAGGALARDPQKSGPVFSETAGDAPAFERARSVRLGRWKLLRRADGSERLFVWEDGLDREIPAARGREERQLQQLSDELTRRQAQEAEGR